MYKEAYRSIFLITVKTHSSKLWYIQIIEYYAAIKNILNKYLTT